jgi:hypothetical protein
MVKENYPGAVKQAVDDILPQWLEAFFALLSVDVGHDLSKGERGWEELAIRAEIFKVCATSSPHRFKGLIIFLDSRHHSSLFPQRTATFVSRPPRIRPRPSLLARIPFPIYSLHRRRSSSRAVRRT